MQVHGEMSRAKVVHLTSAHPATDNRIFHKECLSLVADGYRVVVIAPHHQDEEMKGVQIRAVKRANGRLRRMTQTVMQVYRMALREDAALYHIHDPELLPIGFLLSVRGRKVVYDLHEDFPRQIQSKYWIPAALRRSVGHLAEALETVAVKRFDGLVAATPAIAARLPPGKTAIVQNYPRLSSFDIPAATPGPSEPALVAYVGGLTAIRSAREIMTAMDILPRHLGARLLLAGFIDPPALEDELRGAPGWDRVIFHGWQSADAIPGLLKNARVGLVLFQPTPNHLESQPNKLFEYMAAGVPVVASDFPLWREIVLGTKCGLLADPCDPSAIAAAIQWLLENPDEARAMGARGRTAVLSVYNWESQSEALTSLYDRLLTTSRPRLSAVVT